MNYIRSIGTGAHAVYENYKRNSSPSWQGSRSLRRYRREVARLSQVSQESEPAHKENTSERKGIVVETQLFLKIHVWRTDGGEGRCGHTSTSLHKETADGKPERYVGLWPHKENPLFINHPFAYLFGSVSGEIHPKRKHCEDREGEYSPMHPDVVYTIPLDQLQYAQVEKEMLAETRRVEEGKVLYSLLPRINLVVAGARFFAGETVVRELMDSDFLEAYPEVLKGAEEIREIRAEHCTTISRRIVVSAGVDLKESKWPWIISPIQLDTQMTTIAARRSDIIVEEFRQPKIERPYTEDVF